VVIARLVGHCVRYDHTMSRIHRPLHVVGRAQLTAQQARLRLATGAANRQLRVLLLEQRQRGTYRLTARRFDRLAGVHGIEHRQVIARLSLQPAALGRFEPSIAIHSARTTPAIRNNRTYDSQAARSADPSQRRNSAMVL
jgi:hypothetical protein